MRIRRWLGILGLIGVVGVLAGCALFDPAAVVSFMWTPSDPISRMDVQFTDMSTDAGFLGAGGIASRSWDFGDQGGSSTAANPKHSYAKSGTYDVTLTVTDTGGNVSTLTKTITITASLEGLWTGSITDTTRVTLALRLDLNHSPTGGVSGMITIGAITQPLSSASFNPITGELQLNSTSFNIILRGDLAGTERKISGLWYWENTGLRVLDWTASL